MAATLLPGAVHSQAARERSTLSVGKRSMIPGAPKLNVLILAASVRAGSLNRKLAELAAKIAAGAGATVDLASMRDFDVPLYDGDLQEGDGIPQGALQFQRRLVASDAFIVA